MCIYKYIYIWYAFHDGFFNFANRYAYVGQLNWSHIHQGLEKPTCWSVVHLVVGTHHSSCLGGSMEPKGTSSVYMQLVEMQSFLVQKHRSKTSRLKRWYNLSRRKGIDGIDSCLSYWGLRRILPWLRDVQCDNAHPLNYDWITSCSKSTRKRDTNPRLAGSYRRFHFFQKKQYGAKRKSRV